MKAMTVKQFANWTLTLSSDVAELSGFGVRDTKGTICERLGKLARWALEQGEARGALDMCIADFMARCPAAVRDAARSVVREAKASLVCLKSAKAAPAKKAVRKCKAKAERTDLMSDEDYAEMLQRMDPFEAARIQREE